jgi:hypothetical protein
MYIHRYDLQPAAFAQGSAAEPDEGDLGGLGRPWNKQQVSMDEEEGNLIKSAEKKIV